MKGNRWLQQTTASLPFFCLGMLCFDSNSFAAETDRADRCNRIALEKAAAVLGAPADERQKSSKYLMVSPDDLQEKIYRTHPYSCTIRSKTDFL